MGPSSQIYRFTFDVSGINNCKNKTQKTVRYSFDVVFVNLGLGQSFNKITVLRTFLTFLLVKSVLINLQFCAMFIQNTSIVFLLLIFGIVITTGSTIFYLFTWSWLTFVIFIVCLIIDRNVESQNGCKQGILSFLYWRHMHPIFSSHDFHLVFVLYLITRYIGMQIKKEKQKIHK